MRGNNLEPGEESKKEYSDPFNFGCVLQGDLKHLEEIKEHIITEYVEKGLIKLIRPTYKKSEIRLITDAEWKEYQKLKKKEERLIGAGFL